MKEIKQVSKGEEIEEMRRQTAGQAGTHVKVRSDRAADPVLLK